jgi:hypothetical protein
MANHAARRIRGDSRSAKSKSSALFSWPCSSHVPVSTSTIGLTAMGTRSSRPDIAGFLKALIWTSLRNQPVYFVTVRDRHGRVRSGRVRCGGWFLRLRTYENAVQWDDEAAAK